MALDVFLLGGSGSPRELVTQFEDDGCFSWMRQYWPPTSSNGVQVRLHGRDACYRGAGLAQLRSALERALLRLRDQPDSWKQPTGTMTKPRRGHVLQPVEKAGLQQELTSLLEATDRAERESLELRFQGD